MPLRTNTSNRGEMFLKLLVLFDAITLARGDCLADQHADLMVDAASSQTTGLFLK
jgi:hypothetical protein